MKRHVKHILGILLLGGMLMFCLAGCGKRYKVDYSGDKEWFKGAKDSYPAGKTVTLYYDLIATDTDYSFYLDGQRLNPGYDAKKGFIISFTMPAHDVKLEVSSRNTMIWTPPETELDPSASATLVPDPAETGLPDPLTPTATLVMQLGGKTFYPQLEDNAAAHAFWEKVKDNGPVSVKLADDGAQRKAGTLPWQLPTESRNLPATLGDILLSDSGQLLICRGEHEFQATPLARVDAGRLDELKEVLSYGEPEAKFWLEWSE